MKVVSIFLTNGRHIYLRDRDSSDLSDYSKKLSDLLQNSNIMLLHTTESSLVVRPSKIQAILVDEEKHENEVEDPKSEESSEDFQEPKDIISD